MIEIRKMFDFENWEKIIKSHKYSRKEFKNGIWCYYYDKHNNFSQMTRCNSKTLNVNSAMSAKDIINTAHDYLNNVWIADWKAHSEKSVCKELKGKTISFKSISYSHIGQKGNNSNGKNKNRGIANLLSHVKYLPCAKEILETIGVHTQSRYELYRTKQKDGAVGVVYQTISALAPKGDANNYIQVTVSQKKYKGGKLGDTVYISVVGTKSIKKALCIDSALSACLQGESLKAYIPNSNVDSSCVQAHPSRNFGNFSACQIVDTETVPITNHSIKQVNDDVNKGILKYLKKWWAGSKWHYKYNNPTIKTKKIDEIKNIISGFSKILPRARRQEVKKLLKKLKFDCVAKGVYVEEKRHAKYKKFDNDTNISEKATDDVATYKKELRLAKCIAKKGIKAHVLGIGSHQDVIINECMFFDFKTPATDFSNVTTIQELEKKIKRFKDSIQDNYEKAINNNKANGAIFYIKESKADENDIFDAFKGMEINHLNKGENKKRLDGLAIIYYETIDEIQLIDVRKLRLDLKKKRTTAQPVQKSSQAVSRGRATALKAESLPKKNSIKKCFLCEAPNRNPTKNITHTNNDVNKITIQIKDITKGNRAAKYEQLEKCLNGEKPIYIPADDTERLPEVNITLKDNSPERIEKALRTMSMSLDVPLKSAKGEVFAYKAQEELTDKWCKFFSEYVRNVYDFVTDYFNLPKKTVMEKAVLSHKGKILYYPETGKPIDKKDWDKFIKSLEKFLNRNITDAEKKIVLQSNSLGRVLDRMLQTNTLEAIKKMPLSSITYKGKSFDWISDSTKNMKSVFGEELSRDELARIEAVTQSAGLKISNVSEKIRGDIKQILIDGIRAKQSKGQVSQALFDKMVGGNRDFQRIADTEIQNNFNNAFVREEVQNANENENVYFQRVEIVDNNTCKFCKQMNGKIAKWSDKPLKDEKINDSVADYAIWEGKEWSGKEHNVAIGGFHPYCYSDDTEVMTNNGWKLFKDVEKNDKIMSINPDTKEIDFLPFVTKVQYEYKGKMIHFPGRNFDLLVTPDHNMLYAAGNGHGERHLHGIKASELIKKPKFYLPRAVGIWKKEDVERIKFGDLIISKAQYYKLWAWYLAEGSGRSRNGGYEVKLAQKDPMKIYNDLPELQSVLHITKEAVYLTGDYARYFECMFGIYADKKFIPHFIKNSSKDNIREFLKSFVLADGSSRDTTKKRFFNCSNIFKENG